MNSIPRDYAIFDKFNFERKPVGVRFSMQEPEGLKQLENKPAICEMFRDAQTSEPFFAAQENIGCGDQVLGMSEFPPLMHSGSLGTMFSMFKNAQANARIYEYVPTFAAKTVKYVSFASYDKMNFDPDLLIITAPVAQAEIIMRASSYDTGKPWSNMGTTCLACSWIYAHPYLTGQINYTVSGMGFSMKARQVLPEGLFIISIPNDKILPLIANLKEMEWRPYWFDLGRDEFDREVKKRSIELGKKIGAPSNFSGDRPQK